MIKLPTSLKKEVQKSKVSFSRFPQSYSDFHYQIACDDLAERNNWTVVEHHGLVQSGRLDEVFLLQVVVAIKTGSDYEVKTLRWCDSGAWLENHNQGGFSRFCETNQPTDYSEAA